MTCSRLSASLLLAAGSLQLAAAATAAGVSVSTTSFREWEGIDALQPPRMVYDPFDPELGTLAHVEVVVQGRVAQQLFGGPGASQYSILFTQSIFTDLARAFTSAVPFEIAFSGPIAFQEIVQLEQPFQYIVNCEPSSDVDDICPVSNVTGFTNAASITQMDASLERFTDADPYKNDNVPWRVYTANLFSGLPQDVFLFGEPLIEGTTHIEYVYELEDAAFYDGFSSGGLSCWVASAPGSAAVVEYPLGTGNQMMQLSAPVTLECDLGLDEKPDEIRYDSGFRTSQGMLDVSLGGVVLAIHLASDGAPGDVTLSRIRPSDEQWRSASSSVLAFTLSGPQGAAGLIDNVAVIAAPEPGPRAIGLAAILALAAIARSRRQRTLM